jgi:glycosyltransferase involved in cell wall biosynthesis
MPAPAEVVIAHPSGDVYGSDLQLLETVSAFVDAGVRPRVVLPTDGPLVALLEQRGAVVTRLAFPVLRKSLITPRGLLGLVWTSTAALPRLVRMLRSSPGSPLIVNTVTIPIWAVAGRLCRRHTVTHVHEAEEDGSRLVRRALAAPVLLSSSVVVNSAAAERALTSVVKRLEARITVVHNGVPGPPVPLAPRRRQDGAPATVALVARLSPRKGIDVALDAVGVLRASGRDVRLRICGTTFEGYEWYEREIRERAAAPDLAGAVDFLGYVNPTWPVLEDADIVVVPSRAEPFGNTAVEALHARRSLVASRTQGLTEIVRDGVTGRLVEPGDPAALAAAIADLLDRPELAAQLANAGHDEAASRFSTDAYRSQIRRVVLPTGVGSPTH